MTLNLKIKEYKVRKINNKANGYYNFKRYRKQCLYSINKVPKPSIEKLKNISYKRNKQAKHKKGAISPKVVDKPFLKKLF